MRMRLPLRNVTLVGLLLISPMVWADPSQAGLIGYCSIGGEAIAEQREGKWVLGSNYRILNCAYSNGQQAKVAVCDQHRYHQTANVYPVIWEAIQRGWAADMERGEWPSARRDKYWQFYEGVTVISCDE